MITPIDIRDAISATISGDSALATWIPTQFSSPLTVKKGFYFASDVRQAWFPCAVIVVGDEEEYEPDDGGASIEQVTLLVTCGVHQSDFEADKAEEKVVLLARKVADLFDVGATGFRLGGKAVEVSVNNIKTDAGMLLPKLFRSVALTVIYQP